MSEVEVLLVLISDKNANSIKSVTLSARTRTKANTLRTGLHKRGHIGTAFQMVLRCYYAGVFCLLVVLSENR